MKSFNHRFNTCSMRVAFWEKLSASLASVEAVLRVQGHLTSEDVRVLKVIRQALTDSYGRSRRAREHHSRQLERLRKEYVDER